MASVTSRTLQVRLLILVLLAFIPAIGFFWYTNGSLRELQLEAKGRDLTQRARMVSSEYRYILDQGRIYLASLAEFPEMRSGSAGACSDFLGRVVRHNEAFTTISVIGTDGYLACGAVATESELYLGDRAYFLRATSRRGFAVGEFSLGRISNLPVVGMAQPLLEGEAISRVLAASLDLTTLTRQFHANPLPGGYTATILDGAGRILVRHPSLGDFTLADSVGAMVGPDFPGQPEGRDPVLVEGVDVDGMERLFAVAPLQASVGAPQGYVAIGRTRATLMAEVDEVVSRELRFLAVGAVTLLALAWILGHFWVARVPVP